MLQDYCITVSAYGFTVLTLGQCLLTVDLYRTLLFLQGKVAISDDTVLSDIFSDDIVGRTKYSSTKLK